VRAAVAFIKAENGVWYPSCPGQDCSRKVVQVRPIWPARVSGTPDPPRVQSGDAWRCERCNQTYPTCNYRYMMNLLATDHTGQQWMTAFDAAQSMLGGRAAGELAALRDRDPAAFGDALDELLFRQFVFRVKVESASPMLRRAWCAHVAVAVRQYNDDNHKRSTAHSATPISFAEESRNLLDDIKKYMTMA
jgi:replication factor A1